MTITTQQTLGALALVSPAMQGQELAIDSSAFDVVFDAPIEVTCLEASFNDTTISSTNFTAYSDRHRFTLSLTDLAPSMVATQFLIVGRDYTPAIAISNLALGGAIGIAESTVDTSTSFYLSQVTPGQTITLPTPSDLKVGHVAYLTNTGTVEFTAYSGNVPVGFTRSLAWSGATWVAAAPTVEIATVGHTTPTYSFRLIYTPVSAALPTINPPSGVKSYKGLSTAKVEWSIPLVDGFLGVRVQYSVDSTGINVPYQQFGPLVTKITRTENSIMTLSNTKSVDGNLTTYTDVESTVETNYSSVVFPQSISGGADAFYVVLSTVIQDPQTNHIYESNYNGPYQCGFVDLRQVGPADFPYLQQKEDVASRLIVSATRNYPDLDLTPRSELRDLHIDPISLEISNQSVREWFGRCSESISAMAQIDDYNGDGFSDSTTESPYKNQIARAWNMSAQDVQFLIDRQFDILGENRAGLTRGPATTAVAMVTIYTYTRPSAQVTLSAGDIVVGSTGDGNTVPSLSFYARGSVSVDPNSADSIYDAVAGWWAVQIPVECGTVGSIGNVGSGTITQNLGGLPNGWFCVNQDPAQYGTDRESNAKFAERIKNRMVVGLDTGRRLGYLETARSTPGVVDANVVASGDLMMVRDWLSSSAILGGGKHIYGTVDVYVRGSSPTQQTERRAFTWQCNSDSYRVPSTYTLLTAPKPNPMYSLKIAGALPYSLYAIVEIVAVRGTEQIIMGTSRAKIDAENGVIYLDITEPCYKLSGNSVSENYTEWKTNGAIMNSLASASGVEYRGLFRLRSPMIHVPTYQPISYVDSIIGEEAKTGSIGSNRVRLIKSQDPLLEGASNRATDTIRVDTNSNVDARKTNVEAVVKTMYFTAAEGAEKIDSDMVVAVDNKGRLLGINSVRSEDTYTLYTYGLDYLIEAGDRYGTFKIRRTANSTIPFDMVHSQSANILVGYNKYLLHEYCTPVVAEAITLTGTTASPLAHAGFIKNVWIPESYGYTTLSLDGWNIDPISYTSESLCWANVPRQNRYIKVTYDNGTEVKVMKEDQDFVLTVGTANQAYLSRIMTGRIPDGAVLKVDYFYNETFAVTTRYPGHVEQVAYVIEQSRHAAADVLVKEMTENSVDVILSVELNSNVTPEIMDGRIRTAIGVVLSNTRTKVSQSEIIRQVQSLPGIANVVVPLSKFAKSDGSYNIGHVIPTRTSWTLINQDSAFMDKSFPLGTYISTNSLLQDSTIPSGGLADSYVGLLYEGQSYRRASSLQDFIANPPTSSEGAFYIIGIDDYFDSLTPLPPAYMGRIVIINPSDFKFTSPAQGSYKVTYQVWREGGQKDITLSPTEYLKAGRITIDYM